jgi:hypothetical protein
MNNQLVSCEKTEAAENSFLPQRQQSVARRALYFSSSAYLPAVAMFIILLCYQYRNITGMPPLFCHTNWSSNQLDISLRWFSSLDIIFLERYTMDTLDIKTFPSTWSNLI